MWTHQDLRLEISNSSKRNALKALEAYIQSLKVESPSSLIPEMEKLKNMLIWDINHYSEIQNHPEHKKIVAKHKDNGNENYKYGEEIGRMLSNFEAALSTVNFVLNNYKKPDKINSPKPMKSFQAYFTDYAPKGLPEALRTKFSNDKPNPLAVLIYTLRFEYDPPLLIVDGGDFRRFHAAMEEFFGTPIGKRQYYEEMEKKLSDKKVKVYPYMKVIKNCKDRISLILQLIGN